MALVTERLFDNGTPFTFNGLLAVKPLFGSGPFKCYVMLWGCQLSRKKRYEGVRFNIISVTRGGWGSNFQEISITLHLNGPLW